MADVRPVNQMLADTFEPKRQNRWFFQFAKDVIPQFTAKTFARPTFTLSNTDCFFCSVF